jgi:hypothetical protein
MPDEKKQKNQLPETVSPLEHHVDEMMDIKLPDPKPASAGGVPSAPLYSLDQEDAIEADESDTPEESEVSDAVPVDATDSETPSSPPPLDEADSDPATDTAVDDIMVHESDELLAANDARAAQVAGAQMPKHSFRSRITSFFAAWWQHKLARYGTIVLLLAAIGALATIPTSRYYALNTVGVRSAASLSIVDNTTQLPLRNVTVELGTGKSRSDKDGIVRFQKLQLGAQSLSISQPGFATISQAVTLGLGSNPLGDFTLNAVGTQYRFKLTDYLSGKTVKNAEITSGDSNARSDDTGQLVLTTEAGQTGQRPAKITADGYRAETISLEPGQNQSRTIAMVPAQKEVYISKQSGKYDLYKIDIDGKSKQLLLAASGQEDADISVVQNDDASEAAIVSKRDTTHNQDGYPLQALTLIDVSDGSTLTLDHSERIQIVGWVQDKLVYVKIKAGTSAGNPERYQLMSYDFRTTARLQLASANYFSDVVSAKGAIYFAASNNFQGGVSQLVKINPDNTGKQVILDKSDVWNIIRTSYDSFDLSVLQNRYTYKLGDPGAVKISDSAPNNTETRFYLDAADGDHALWTDSRDGKGVLLVYNAATGKDTTLVTQTGLSYPVRWLNARSIVYRVTTPAETADYVVSLDGGAAKKIVDLTPTAGFGKWNYR